MSGVRPHVELHRCRFQRVELIQERLFREDTFGETALRLVVGVDEVLHGATPWLVAYSFVYIHDLRYIHTSSYHLAHVHLLLSRLGVPGMAHAHPRHPLRHLAQRLQALVDTGPLRRTQLTLEPRLGACPQRQRLAHPGASLRGHLDRPAAVLAFAAHR